MRILTTRMGKRKSQSGLQISYHLQEKRLVPKFESVSFSRSELIVERGSGLVIRIAGRRLVAIVLH